ncbi:gag-polypeptide of LTR copia-type [Phytophthora infestans]|uniref:Gag-polypeptide of LTR copia-type n=1 Tax=Phytophthora infestans TaxID=4787 RepID=A0A8S9TVH9_PHYIN|nr:gag-polypeptide of LTR copia-type [Phytophthora infestans]
MEANDLWDIAILKERSLPRSGCCAGTKRYAYEVLVYLEVAYEAKNGRNFVAFRETFISFEYEKGQEVTVLLNKLTTVAEKFARQGKTVDDKEHVWQLLASLSELWTHFESVD